MMLAWRWLWRFIIFLINHRFNITHTRIRLIRLLLILLLWPSHRNIVAMFRLDVCKLEAVEAQLVNININNKSNNKIGFHCARINPYVNPYINIWWGKKFNYYCYTIERKEYSRQWFFYERFFLHIIF